MRLDTVEKKAKTDIAGIQYDMLEWNWTLNLALSFQTAGQKRETQSVILFSL